MVSGVRQDRAGRLAVLSIAVRLHLGAVLLSGEGCADHFSGMRFPDRNRLLIFLFLCFSSSLSSDVAVFCSAALCSINARAQCKVLGPLSELQGHLDNMAWALPAASFLCSSGDYGAGVTQDPYLGIGFLCLGGRDGALHTWYFHLQGCQLGP